MKKNYIYALVTVSIWATGATLLKSITAGLPSLEVLCAASFLSCAFLLIKSAAAGKLKTLREESRGQLPRLCGLGFIGLFLYNALYYRGLTILSAHEACILNYLWPVMIVVFSAILLGEPLGLLKVFSILCSFAGVVLLCLDGSSVAVPHHAQGVVCCLTAAACYGLFSVVNKKWNLDQDLVMLVVWAVTAVGALVLGLITEQWVPIGIAQVPGILWMGVVVNGFSYLIWALALNGSSDSSRIAGLAYLTPFLSVILSALFLNEKLTVLSVLALVIIVGGILLPQVAGRK